MCSLTNCRRQSSPLSNVVPVKKLQEWPVARRAHEKCFSDWRPSKKGSQNSACELHFSPLPFLPWANIAREKRADSSYHNSLPATLEKGNNSYFSLDGAIDSFNFLLDDRLQLLSQMYLKYMELMN